jgi:ADP-heptose:LPS heptosyltransferase
MNITRLETLIEDVPLLLRCYFFFLIHGKADKKISLPKSIVIIQRAKLGDMVVTTSMFRAVKKSYPGCKVTVVGNAVNKKVLEGNPDVDEYIVWEDNMGKMIRRFKQGQYDFGCMTSPNFHSLAALYLSGVKSIAAPLVTNGWSPYETKSYKLIRNFVIKKEHRMRQYVPKEYLRLLEPIGIFAHDTTKYVFWSKDAESKIDELISKIDKEYSLLVGIMPGAGNKVKEWLPERFAQIADYLVEKYKAYIMIVGGSSNRKEIDEMLALVKHKDWVTDCSWVSIDELKALVSKLEMTVSVDTGPVFIAEANSVPTIDIAGSIHPDEMAPNDGKFHLLVRSQGEPEIWTMNARILNYERARSQIESITVSMVTEKIDELIKKIRTRSSATS